MNNFFLSFNHSPYAFNGAESVRLRSNAQQPDCPGCDVPTDGGNTLPGTVNYQEALGSSLSSLSVSIGSLRDRLNQLVGSGADNGTAPGSVDSFSASLVSKQRGELTIRTLEGDEVTLKFSNKVRVDYSSQGVQSGAASLNGESLDVYRRSRVSLSVAGDLNSEELTAINELVGKVGDLAQDFYSGNVEQALANSASLSFDDSQLSDYSLNLSLKQSVRIQGYRYVALPPTSAPAPTSTANEVPVAPVPDAAPSATPPATPVVVPVSNPTAAIEAAQVPPASSNPTTANDAAAVSTPSVPDAAPAPASSEVTVPPVGDPAPQNSVPTAQQIIASYSAKVRQSLSVSSTDAALGFSYEFKVRLLISVIGQTAPQTPPAAEALDVLTQQVQPVAAA